jgi:translation initiation factor 3 subunit E
MSFDLTERLLPQLDRHLCLPLLDFLDSNGSYEHRDLLHAKLEILKSTNMVTYLAQLDKELDNNQSLQQGSLLSTGREGQLLKDSRQTASKGKSLFYRL